MRNYVLLIKREQDIPLEEIEKYLKVKFKSWDYMTGFLDGYLFGEYKILKLEDFEKHYRSQSQILLNKWLKFVSIEEE